MKVTYQNGKKYGLDTEWYLDGKKASEKKWKKGVPHGKWTAWNEDGSIDYKRNYRNGKLIK